MGKAILLEPLEMAAIAASNTASGFAAANLAIDRMGLVWRSDTGSATRNITVDMGADVPVDTIALFGIGAATATPSGSWQWSIDLATAAQGAFGGAFWAGSSETLLAGTTLPESGRGKALWLAPGGAPAAARHVRINFSALGTSAIQAARLCIGVRFQPERNFTYGAALGVRPLGNVEFNQRGVLRRRRGVKLRAVGLQFTALKRDELEGTVQRMFERIGNDNPLVLVSDPDVDVQRQNRIYFGFLTGDIGSVFARAGGFRADINLVAMD